MKVQTSLKASKSQVDSIMASQTRLYLVIMIFSYLLIQ